jgi:peptide-methionine (R)-S-oxide reductase
LSNMKPKIKKSEDEWRKILTPEEFHVLREKGTERPFTGKYVNYKQEGTFVCAGCGNELFSSNAKFDSGTGWPSFWAPISKDSIKIEPDNSLGIRRSEILCSRCGGHLGHVFEDGPKPTGRRFCINSAALHFEEKQSV